MKITILALNYAPEPSGTAPYTSKLAEEWASKGHEVTVVAGYPHYPQWKLAPDYNGWSSSEVLNGVVVHRLRHYIPKKVSTISRLHLEISFGIRMLFARWYGPDVVVIVTPALFATGFAIFRSFFAKARYSTGIWVQDLYSRGVEETGSGSSLVVNSMKVIEGFILKSATMVTVIHDRFAEYIVSELGVSPANVRTIRNWSHLQLDNPSDRNISRRSLGWRGDDIIVLHAGNMGVKQGLHNVVAAARIAQERSSRIRFVLLGDGNQRKEIENIATGIGNIEFISSLPESAFQEALRAADILLVNELAGLREMSVPSKLTAYFSTALPVIAATEAGSTTASEIEISGGGMQVNPGEPQELFEAAQQLASDPARMEVLGRSGQAYAKSRLTHDAAMMEYDTWLRDLYASNI